MELHDPSKQLTLVVKVIYLRCLSAQPVFGGPVYFIRNVVYNAPTALKFTAKPTGLLVYHNTIIFENRNTQTFSNAHFRNNLFLGTDGPGRAISAFPNASSYSTYDDDGYRPNRTAADRHIWIAPRKGELRNYEIGPRDSQRFKTLPELAAATGQETHVSKWTTTSSKTCAHTPRVAGGTPAPPA
jgi:hypothetical protein